MVQYFLNKELGLQGILKAHFLRPLENSMEFLSYAKIMPSMVKTPADMYSQADLEILAASEDTRARYVEALASRIVPKHRGFLELYLRFRHHLDLPETATLQPFFATSGMDLATVGTPHRLAAYLFHHCAFVDGWGPILRRWQDGDFSAMQPAEPDCSHLLLMMFMTMVATAGEKEQKLQVYIVFYGVISNHSVHSAHSRISKVTMI